ncbi:MAG: DUF2911 domain-containing protein [Bacteroidetes bacterium]|nr:DUF2911 domain-containing protein [Bacteroidota bacterium]
MVKKILIGLAVLAAVVVIALWYLNSRNKTLSPPGKTEFKNGNLQAAATYSRPSVRGRVIFGPKEQGALQPYGAYWRLGANESTELTVNTAFVVDGKMVLAGTYKIYAIPGPDEFEIVFNSELGTWGAGEPNHSLDVMRVSVPVEKVNPPVEQFTIRMDTYPGEAENQAGIQIIFEWSDVRFVLPILQAI